MYSLNEYVIIFIFFDTDTNSQKSKGCQFPNAVGNGAIQVVELARSAPKNMVRGWVKSISF